MENGDGQVCGEEQGGAAQGGFGRDAGVAGEVASELGAERDAAEGAEDAIDEGHHVQDEQARALKQADGGVEDGDFISRLRGGIHERRIAWAARGWISFRLGSVVV